MRIFTWIFLSWTWWRLAVNAEEECKDHLTFCDSLKSFCNHAEHRVFARTNCPVICKRCPKDVDPLGLCTDNNGGCEHICEVINKEKKECSCYEGYKLSDDKHACDDIDECANESCPIGQHCRNFAGSFTCEVARCGGNTHNYLGRAECCQKEPADAECGITGVPDKRVVGGKDAYLGQWPWQVLLYFDRQNLCGGTLLSSEWVITAGHCFKGFSSGKTKVELFFGALDRNKLTRRHVQKRVLKQYVKYPNWDEDKFETNDVALIKLDRPVTFGKWVRPVCLPNGEKPKVGYKCHVAGWGLLDEEGTTPADKLQHVDLPIADPAICEHNYRKEEVKVNSTIMVCAGYDEGGKDACRGDSGGPLVCQRCDSCGWYLAGVVSFGSGCAQKGFYGVFADVHYYEKWISEITSIHISGEKSCTGPYFTQWSKWSQCTKSCGSGGKHTRTRECLHKGKTSDKCNGEKENTADCPVKTCPTLGAWGQWSECSATCGGGEQSQIRKCRNGKIGQDGCPTNKASKTQSCNEQECPFWGVWTPWKTCTKTCGKGESERTRRCVNGEPGQKGCNGDEKETKACNTSPCPGWSTWGPWGKCSVTCARGKQTSKRTCIGKGTCPGGDSRTQDCNTQLCPAFGEWGQWAKCDVTCNGGNRRRTRPCKNGKIGEVGCEKGSEIEKVICNTQECPAFSSWSTWGKCTVSCGGGDRKATRTCRNGVVGDKGCIGDVEKIEKCSTDECIGTFGPWGRFSECSMTCDEGSQKRSRQCEGGTKCNGEDEETRTCRVKNCPTFDDWTDWGKCSKTCGGGEQSRSRKCLYTTNPEDCKGDADESRKCNNQICPGKWTKWSEWSKCVVSCGEGVVKRTRGCEGGEVGKVGCDDGPAEQTKPCVKDPCPSSWGQWVKWSTCSQTCDRGLQTRTRPCDGGKPGQGGCVPASSAKEEQNCNEITCVACFDVDDNYCERYFSTKRQCNQNFDYGQRYCPAKCNFCPALYEHWNSWEACSSTCGSGFRKRTRECKSPQFGCDGVPSQTEKCQASCRGFSNWSDWSDCSKSCNGGTRTRSRECPFDRCDPDETGKSSLTDEERCNAEACPGVWEKWGDWGPCSATCGNKGIEEQTRKCIGGKPGGPGCPGSEKKTRPCSESKRCPGKWTVWSDWSKCPVTCGEGQRERTRICENGVKGEPNCLGNDKEKESCDAGECIGAKWGDWDEWGECNNECVRSRKRKCNGGNTGDVGCRGQDTESEDCDPSTCGVSPDSCDLFLFDTSSQCFTIQDQSCLFANVQQACPKTCCEALKRLPCEDDPANNQYCSYTHLCNDPRYVDTIFKPYCRLSCGFCTP